jgi:hypothetical protein
VQIFYDPETLTPENFQALPKAYSDCDDAEIKNFWKAAKKLSKLDVAVGGTLLQLNGDNTIEPKVEELIGKRLDVNLTGDKYKVSFFNPFAPEGTQTGK